ncbi:chromosomal replication initiation protein DnaA [Bowdeniella nasicola]|uniref:Chromosomal replication initiator protein DnaA n=1 Tax=Bowdeniella nasicola TaxID=208480 RepID=A0A1Q5Q3B7_9ACTO|nr:chromosomal replication initiator protein DnaA [Bowdeniella nasicola]OKL54318.1 chromosomal replication initiation protein DnaA [Bowdeniella nasicola]
MDLSELWNSVISRLQQDPSNPRVSMAFTYLARPTAKTDQHLIVEVPSGIARDHLETHLRDALHQAVAEITGQELSLIFAVNPELENMPMSAVEATPAPAREVPKTQEEPVAPPLNVIHPNFGESSSASTTEPPARSLAKPTPLPLDDEDPARLNPKYTFETFVTGPSNRFAQAAATAVAEAPAKAYSPLFIYGGSGLGKTHLLHAIGHYARHLFSGIRVKYVNSEEFTNDFINSIRDDKAENFQRRYRNVDVLLIDDIQFLGGKEQTVEEFFHTFNTLYNDSKQVVITSDIPPKQLQGFGDRLISRFEMGLLTDVQPPDLETRIAILRKKAQAESLEVGSDVLEYIATRIVTNIRELEGALIRVTAFANLNRTPVDLSLAELVLKDIITDPNGQEITPAMIMTQTAKHFDISIEALRSPDRTRTIVTARQIAMYLCRELTDLSLPNIGEAFGKDHTTVMHAVKKITAQLAEKPNIYQQVKDLTMNIRQHAMRGGS